ncbi:piggyBac transposable element-derived protein 4-like [Lineus longissimus]|uniref:piggyBac transposable element-derived protein 4-like n=1 Tax=Lineus longissimus TaxID=88925 RepID=UPI00315CE03D
MVVTLRLLTMIVSMEVTPLTVLIVTAISKVITLPGVMLMTMTLMTRCQILAPLEATLAMMDQLAAEEEGEVEFYEDEGEGEDEEQVRLRLEVEGEQQVRLRLEAEEGEDKDSVVVVVRGGNVQGGGDVNPPRDWTNQIVQPVLQPFTAPSGVDCGLRYDADELDYLMCILGGTFWDTLAENTNLYAAKTHPPAVPDPNNPFASSNKHWKPSTPEEIRAFTGINILMGIKDYPEYGDYWSADSALGDKFISSIMTKNTYEQLCKYLHCSNPNVIDRHDKLDKVRWFIVVLNENFPRMFKAGENISIDEAMVKFDGRLAWKQYIPKKPIKWGIKIWCLCDSGTGYTLAFKVYTGAAQGDQQQGQDQHGLGYNVVTDLLREYIQGVPEKT